MLKMFNKTTKLNFRLSDIMRAGLGLMAADGGFVIGIQITTFLLTYFISTFYLKTGDIQDITNINKMSIFIALISMLNLAAIIYRIAGLANGIKYGPIACYQRALRRWPVLTLLYLTGTILFLLLATPIIKILSTLMHTQSMHYNILVLLGMLMLLPYGILACVFVIEQEKNPFQAIRATFNIAKNIISIRLLLNISFLYALPLSLMSLLSSARAYSYLGLFNAIWFLFCHILMIIIYTSSTIVVNPDIAKQKPTKVIIV